MKTYNHKRRNLFSIGSHLLGIIFISVGLFTIVSPVLIDSDNSISKALFVGAGFTFFGLAVVFSYGGTFINFESKKFKDYYSLCGIQMGQWQDLSEVKKVIVISDKYKGTSISNGINPSISGEIWIYKALLYSKYPKPIFSFEYFSKERTLVEAKVLAENFNAVLELRLTEINGKFSD